MRCLKKTYQQLRWCWPLNVILIQTGYVALVLSFLCKSYFYHFLTKSWKSALKSAGRVGGSSWMMYVSTSNDVIRLLVPDF